MPPDGPSNSFSTTTTTSSSSTSHNNTSNIRVFVRWHEQVVFAGEELKCTITFKNVARLPTASSSPSSSTTNTTTTTTPPSSSTNTLKPFPPNASRHPNADHLHHPSHHQHRGPRQPSPLHPNRSAAAAAAKHSTSSGGGLAPPSASTGARGHRSSLSLSVPSAASRARAGSVGWSPALGGGTGSGSGSGTGGLRRGGSGGVGVGEGGSAGGSTSGNAGLGGGMGNGNGHGNGRGHGHGHKRSVSIVSIGSLSTVDDGQAGALSSPKPSRPRGHARASSLQILPRGGLLNGPRSGEFDLEMLGERGEEVLTVPFSDTPEGIQLTIVAPFPRVIPAGTEHQWPPTGHCDRSRHPESRFPPPVARVTKPARRVQVPHVALANDARDRRGACRRRPDEPDIEWATNKNEGACPDDKRTRGGADGEDSVNHEHSRDAEE